MYFLAEDYGDWYEGWAVNEIKSLEELKNNIESCERDKRDYKIFKEVTLAEVTEALEKEGMT
jgi:hypothetical protein